jgi:hypothetical protein
MHKVREVIINNYNDLRALKIYVAAKWRRSSKRKDRMKLSLALKLVGKTSLGPS